MTDTKRVGVLTGGGDAPGLNPAIKGLVYRGSQLGLEVIGLFDGWRSLINPAPEVLPLDQLAPEPRGRVAEVLRDHTFHRQG